MFSVPLSAARVMLVVMAVLFALSVIEGNMIFVIHATIGLFMAGYLVGSAEQTAQR